MQTFRLRSREHSSEDLAIAIDFASIRARQIEDATRELDKLSQEAAAIKAALDDKRATLKALRNGLGEIDDKRLRLRDKIAVATRFLANELDWYATATDTGRSVQTIERCVSRLMHAAISSARIR